MNEVPAYEDITYSNLGALHALTVNIAHATVSPDDSAADVLDAAELLRHPDLLGTVEELRRAGVPDDEIREQVEAGLEWADENPPEAV